MACSLPFLLEDLPDTESALVEKTATSIITNIPEDQPSIYNVVVTSKDSSPEEETHGSKDISNEQRLKGLGDQICPGDLEQCLEACLPVLAILELAHTYCVAECNQRCAP